MQPHKCYVEVFGGGLSVLFNKKPTTQEVLNDINSELINFWKVIQNNYEAFRNGFKYMIPSREMFLQYKAQDISQLSELDRAIRFFYLNRTCFGGDMDNPRFGTSNSRRNRLCAATDDLDKVLSPAYQRLKDVTIENLDWLDCLKRYDSKPTSKEKQNVLFYLDPPYIEQYGYEHGFTSEDHETLADTLKNIDGKFILSINNHPLVFEFYKDLYYIDKELKCTLSNKSDRVTSRKELIITNFEVG
jgi:DNA adenine methylase